MITGSTRLRVRPWVRQTEDMTEGRKEQENGWTSISGRPGNNSIADTISVWTLDTCELEGSRAHGKRRMSKVTYMGDEVREKTISYLSSTMFDKRRKRGETVIGDEQWWGDLICVGS